MSLKKQLMADILSDPLMVRDMFNDPEVLNALGSLGILPKVLELHAPSDSARTPVGLGLTLCGIRGTRHKNVTCKKCLKKLQGN